MRQTTQRGVTLIELMVALAIGMLASLVIQQVMAVFEAQKRTSSSGSDAQVNGAVALFSLEREIRQAGYGYLTGGALLCPLGINIYYNGATTSNGGGALPIQIVDGGAGPDTIRLVRSDVDFTTVPTSISLAMPTPSSILNTYTDGGLHQNDLFIVASQDGSKVCTLMQLSQDPQQTGNYWNLQHNSGQYLYNPSNPANAFTTAPLYGKGDLILKVGGVVARSYQVSADQLVEVTPPPDPPTPIPLTSTTTPLVEQIVDLKAQYGVAPAGSQQITQWCNATATSTCGDWSNPSATDILRVRALKIAVVARSIQYEKDVVSPASLTLWDAGDAGDAPPTFALTSDQQHYRFKVFSTIVPLRNIIWAGT